jgi:endonuclease/exonuclease/phosphatase family metal-dependent hydrolase
VATLPDDPTYVIASGWISRLGTTSFVITVLLAMPSCGRKADQQVPMSSTSSSAAKSPQLPLRVLTFNAGLAPQLLPNVDERSAAIANALGSLNANVACLQEVWLDRHYQKIVSQQNFARTLRPPHAPAPEGLCSASESARAFACVRMHCGDVQKASAQCIAQHCGGVKNSISPGCQSCLTADPTRTPADTYGACVSDRAIDQSKPSTRPAYVFGGSYGLALLFQREVLQNDFLALPSRLVARGAVYARLAMPAPMHRLHVFCTHLTPDSKEENRVELDALLAFIEKKAPRGEPVLLLGDLNMGPSSEGVRAKLPEHFQALVRAGFSSPYLGADSPSCTFCDANPMVSGRGGGGSVIDHTLVRGLDWVVRSDRVLDDSIELQLERRTLTSTYSDHYGVLSSLLPGEESG